MYVHALHTVHAVPDLRVAGGRLGDGVSLDLTFGTSLTRSMESDSLHSKVTKS